MNETATVLDALLTSGRVIPVITIERLGDAVPLARALVSGGIRLLEVTLRTPVGLDAAAAIMAQVPGAVVGVGTVLTPGDLARAVAIGARFALSPGATPALLAAAAAAPIPFLPGVATASELMAAAAHGFGTVKFFPATAGGGIAALRALAGPFPNARFCPTGGITAENAAQWLALPNVAAVGGSWLTPAADMAGGRWHVIEGAGPARGAALARGAGVVTSAAGQFSRPRNSSTAVRMRFASSPSGTNARNRPKQRSAAPDMVELLIDQRRLAPERCEIGRNPQHVLECRQAAGKVPRIEPADLDVVLQPQQHSPGPHRRQQARAQLGPRPFHAFEHRPQGSCIRRLAAIEHVEDQLTLPAR